MMHHHIVHLTDLHIGAGEVRRWRTSALVEHIQQTFGPGETTVCITGDLTEGTLDPLRQREHRREMQDAARELRPLLDAGFGLMVVPGNHDQVPRGATMVLQQHVEWYEQEIHAELMAWAPTLAPWALLVSERLMVIGLDTMQGQRGLDFDFARGCSGAEQLRKLRALLEANRRRMIVVIMHHNTDYDVWTNKLEDEAPLLALLEEFGVKVLLEGHEHRWRERVTSWGMLKLGGGRSTDTTDGHMRYRSVAISDTSTVVSWHEVPDVGLVRVE